MKNLQLNHTQQQKDECFFPITKNRSKVFVLTTSVQHSLLEILTNETKSENEINSLKIGKKDTRLSLFTNDQIVSAENLEYFIFKNPLEQISNLLRLCDIKSTHKNHLYSYVLTTSNYKMKF